MIHRYEVWNDKIKKSQVSLNYNFKSLRYLPFKIWDTLWKQFISAINYYYYRTNGDYQHEEFVSTTELTYIVFEVMAAMRAQVALLFDPKNTQGISPMYAVSEHIITTRIHNLPEGKLLSHVCLSTWGPHVKCHMKIAYLMDAWDLSPANYHMNIWYQPPYTWYPHLFKLVYLRISYLLSCVRLAFTWKAVLFHL